MQLYKKLHSAFFKDWSWESIPAIDDDPTPTVSTPEYKLHWHIGTWHMEHPLLSRSELTAIGTIANMLVELNKAPARYYNKFNSEGHIYNYTSGSIVYKCLSNDWTSIYYQSGTWKYAYYNESTWLWAGAWGWVY